tara:strand:+ start:11222 stop:12427 length:1206 start_codon:yes stop_codon:yes gene_type:complete
MLVCKRCGHDDFIRKGTDPNGKKRHKCKECGSQAWPIEIEPEVDDEVLKENVKLAKEKQKAQDKNRVANKAFRELARLENCFEEYAVSLREILERYDFSEPKQHETTNPSAMVVHLTDVHFNELVDIAGNKYDFKVASKRLYKFADKISYYSQTHNIKNIYFVMTGDLLNSDRRLDEILTNSTNRAKATFLAIKLLAQFIKDLNYHANVSVFSVTGNESRIRDEYTHIDELATENFDFMIYEALKILLHDGKGINFISGDSFEYVMRINGATFLLVHGHNLKDMGTNVVAKVIKKYCDKDIKLDYILCGHLHETRITDTLMRGGSLVGSNAYSDIGLNLTSKASQNLHIIYGDGSVDSIRVDLQDTDDIKIGYEIDKDLESYNAKSVDKTKSKTKIFEVRV